MTGMHYGRISHEQTRAARLYRYLRSGAWLSPARIGLLIGTTNPTTVLSEVRRQLPPGEMIVRECRGRGRNFYRLVTRAGM